MPILLYDALSFSFAALQSVHKRHWRELEHMLYCRLVYHGNRASLIASSTAGQSKILADFYSEPEQLKEELLAEYLITASTFFKVNFMLRVIRSYANLSD